jgi:hypothetical protein
VVSGDDVLYNAWLVRPVLKVDQAIHFYAYAIVTVVCWQALRRYSVPPTVAVLAAVGLGSLNEVVEFIGAAAVENDAVGGFENMGWDLVFNLGGAVAAGLAIRLSGVDASLERGHLLGDDAVRPVDVDDARREAVELGGLVVGVADDDDPVARVDEAGGRAVEAHRP